MRYHDLAVLAFCGCLLGILDIQPQGAIASAAADEDMVALVRHLQEVTGMSKGVCSILGCNDGRVPLAVARSSGFFVFVQDPRPEAVAAARKVVDDAGLYGKRVVVEVADISQIPLANATADLILATDVTPDQLGQLVAAEIVRALRPGGKAVLGQRKQKGHDSHRLTAGQLRAWLEGAPVDQASVAEDAFGVWAQVTRPPLKGIDTWSHWEHAPDNNPVSTDTVIKAPYMTQWLGMPLYIAMPAITTSAGGRLFIAMGHIAHHQREEPWLNTLLARNGYNGTILWQLKLPDGYLAHRSAFIATEDTFHMIDLDGSGCLLLDPETGAEKGRISIPELGNDEWKWMAMKDGVLYALAGPQKDPAETTVVRSEQTHWSWGELSPGYYTKRVPWGFGTTIAAYDMRGGKTLWSHRENAGIDSRGMAIGGERVFFYGPDSHAGCLNAATGKVVWTNADPQLRKLVEEPGHGLGSTPGFRSTCFSLYTPKALVFEAQTQMNVVAVSTEDGRILWQRRKTTNNPNMLYADDRLYLGVGADGSTMAIDPLTGKILADLGFKKRSCARLTASPDSFFCRGWPEGLTRYDRKTGQILFNGAFRPSCNDGVIPAGGLLYFGPWACDCNLSVMGHVALCSANDLNADPQAPTTRQLEGGGEDSRRLEPLEVSDKDWPTYRANTARSAASAASLSGPLSRIWQYSPETAHRPTAPTAAGGLVFVGGDDGKVRAFDAATGSLVWSYATAGPIMQPPTISNSRAYAGSGDGHVYALEAKTGRLLWRYRVAPLDRRIMVYGALCSTWPVNSGVLVHDGVAYAAAGIVDYDGTYICALDAVTGQVKWRNDSSGHLDPALRKGVSAQGTLTLANGRLWMAGGNVISPAAYDLQTGRYIGESAGDGSPRANRGEEVAIFRDRYVMLGGRLRYSAVRNVVNPGTFTAQAMLPDQELGPAAQINTGKIAPAWDTRTVAVVDGRNSPPKGYSADAFEEYLRSGKLRDRPVRQWTCEALQGSDTVSVAIAQDAVVIVCSMPKARDWQAAWRLCSLDRDGGSLFSQQELPSEALPGGLLVDRDGRVVVAMQDGTLSCFGGDKALAASVRHVMKIAQQGDAGRTRAVEHLRHTLKTTQTPAARDLVQGRLAELGIHVGDQAAENGGVARWHLIGTVPWNMDDNNLDKVFVGEPDVNVSQPVRIATGTLRWREYVTDEPYGKVNLLEIFGPPENIAAYGYAEVRLPQDQDLLLKIGSNDGFKCWFNGAEVARFDSGRSYGPDQDSVPVKARKGVNRILIKVSQHGGEWAFSVRLTDPADKPVDLRQAYR